MDDALAAIVEGRHGDPFAVLGMHADGGGLVVRTFQPGAAAVALLDEGGRTVATLARVDEAGLFVGNVPRRRKPFRYRLSVEAHGESRIVEDPYRFPPFLGELDVHLLGEGNHLRAYERLGAHVAEIDGVKGVAFAVWAPNAQRVSVVGPFNDWDGRRHVMRLRIECGVWEVFVPGIEAGTLYKYEIRTRAGAILPLKADPYAFHSERPPSTASIVFDLARTSADEAWAAARAKLWARDAPIAIYEVHLGSWRRGDANAYLSYRALADQLVPYAKEMGFTHIELMPIAEHPFDGSWGYQPLGLFAPTSRFGTPDDFSAFVARCHAEGLGVLCDWVPAHFPSDAHGLQRFDGTHLFEHADPRQGFHPDWSTMIYNFGRREVANFLTANALFWLRQYELDGLRVDAVASMLYLDYSRRAGQWIPNRYGGNENLEAVDFLRRLNERVYGEVAGVATVAEESTAWPGVSRPVYLGGLGFGYKWNMGWMNDTLRYMSKDPIHRRFHHNDMTFGLLYAFNENFILPLSHDEVVHGKGSLINKMPGDRWQKFANLRAYFGFMYGHPGKKLMFMGAEIAQEREWNHDRSLDWHLLEDPSHRGMQALVKALNTLYRRTPALHARDCEAEGFSWIDGGDSEQCVLSFVRIGRTPDEVALVVSNFTPLVRANYRLGVPLPGRYAESLNTDSDLFGGSNVGNLGGVASEPVAWHGRAQSIVLTLPPLATLILVPEPSASAG